MPGLVPSLLASAVVAAIVAGLFGYYTSTKVAKLKASISTKAEVLKKLDEAYQKASNINWKHAGFSLSEFHQDPEALKNRMVKEHTALYTEAYSIYVSIRPYLSSRSTEDLEQILHEVNSLNATVVEIVSKTIENPSERLVQLMSARDRFGKSLCAILENEIKNIKSG